jgi:hypothetical protein
MNETDNQAIRNCYRTLRNIALRTEDPHQKQGLNTTCALLLRVLGEDAKLDPSLAELINKILGSKSSFLFVPFL